MTVSVFDYLHYQPYLRASLSHSAEARGRQSQLAKYLRCQSSFVSQVVGERTHLSLEHAVKSTQFLNLNAEEKHYFMLLVQKDKAASQDLVKYFQGQIDELQKRRQFVRERMKVEDEIRPQDHAIYYGVWWYLAIHILVALPGTQTRDEIAKRLSLGTEQVREALQFLVKHGLITESRGKYSIAKGRIHLGQGSPMLPRHHANWRMRAIQAVDLPKEDDLHFSGVIGISRKDGEKIRSTLLELLQKTEPVIQASQEEAAYVFLMDFFEL